jgi:D-3-phosphoglycerate dehydrogenase
VAVDALEPKAATPVRVTYLEYLAHRSFADVIATRPNFTLTRIDRATPKDDANAILGETHIFQIPATRSDVQARYRANAALFALAPRLLVVSSSGAGYDTIDLSDCTRAGVLAVNQTGGNREAVAEHALAMMLCLSKRIPQIDRAMRRAAIDDRTLFMGNDVMGKTIGIIGLGAIGTRLAEICRGIFAMTVHAYDPLLSPAEIVARGGVPTTLDTLLGSSDFVSLHCPLSDETRGMIGARAFALMQPNAYFITTARGGVHDEDALAAALASGTIAGAGLDVWSSEPPPTDHPLLAFDNVIASAHTAGVTHEARHAIATMAAKQIFDLVDGKRAPRLLNPEAWDTFAARFTRTFGCAPTGS